MSKKVVMIILSLIIIGIVCIDMFMLLRKNIEKNENKIETEVKNNKETIYGLFTNFPDSKNIYYTSKNLYSERDVGPTIYQIDILAELTDKAYSDFVKQAELETLEEIPEIKINPHNTNYKWDRIKNLDIIKSKDVEDASIRNIYLDGNTKTIYVIVLGGN